MAGHRTEHAHGVVRDLGVNSMPRPYTLLTFVPRRHNDCV